MFESILTGYICKALSHAEYDKLDDGSFYGRIPRCKGVIVFGKTRHECENKLQSALEDWISVGLKLGHQLPVIDVFDLNKEPTLETMAAV